jgi:hypothetical protein
VNVQQRNQGDDVDGSVGQVLLPLLLDLIRSHAPVQRGGEQLNFGDALARSMMLGAHGLHFHLELLHGPGRGGFPLDPVDDSDDEDEDGGSDDEGDVDFGFRVAFPMLFPLGMFFPGL